MNVAVSAESASRYVPHTDTTRTHYEGFLLELRRSLPPGAHDDLADIAEEALSIVCSGAATGDGISEQHRRLEMLLDTKLTREARDRLVKYGRLITDYVVTAAVGRYDGMPTDAGDGDEQLDADGGMATLDIEGRSGSSSSDEEEEDLALLTGTSRRGARRKGPMKDNNLVQFAFTGGGGDEVLGMGVDDDSPPSSEVNGGDVDGVAPRISFDDVACNPQYIRDSLRRLFPANSVEASDAQAARVVGYLDQKGVDQFTLETQLTAYLGGYDDEAVMEWIGDVAGSRWSIAYGLRFANAKSQREKEQVMDAMREHAATGDSSVEWLYQSLTGKASVLGRCRSSAGNETSTAAMDGAPAQPPLRRVDLQGCAFQDERTPHQHVRATVPGGTQRLVYETHDEVILPPSAAATHHDALVPISTFPEWAQPAFAGVQELNAMQSAVYDCAFGSDENMLVTAPTGAGKTNVAMMAMLRAIQNTMQGGADIHARAVKMVYVAPMKALVQEVVRTFSARLNPLGITVAELSGDSTMTQQQMLDTQLIVATPEKWDIVTRKSVELGVAALLKLLIIDEVHLLHNERGPVLEAIVARTMLQQQLRGESGIRLIGLSATLSNHDDVAAFLQVDRQRGLHVFGSAYRPVPLQQTFCAIKKLKGSNHAAVMNRVVYDKVLAAVRENEQVMIFVHSRKDTEHTAMFVRQRAAEEHRLPNFVRPGSESELRLQEAANNPDHRLRRSLQQLLPAGCAIHHAGLSREERHTVESLFADRHVKVLVCTSTLAWGVNLPANTVIIKGTRVFNGARGASELLSALDVLQMFGRAGRVGFGSNCGKASIITTPDDLHYYLCVLNEQLPIESQMMKRVVDMLNAEIVLGHVSSVEEGVWWLQRTYVYIRMRQVPEVYGIRRSASDPLLLHHLSNIVHTAAEELKGCRLADYDWRSRKIGPTSYGRIASHSYVTCASMALYLTHLGNAMQDVDVFRVFSLSSEFGHLTVRAEEQAQLKELLENAPIAVRESRYTPVAKINILLQCYISGKDLEGLPLMSELVYIKDSAQRILRALFEICLVREYGRTARQVLHLYQMVVHRQWSVQSPIRQVRDLVTPKIFEAILPSLERARVPWETIRQWSVEDLSEKLGDERRASMAHDCIHHVPHYAIEASIRPLSRSMLYVDVDITPDFTYNDTLHGRTVQQVMIMVEQTDGRLLYHEALEVPMANIRSSATYSCPTIVVPMVEPKPAYLYARCVSLHWLAAETTVPICLLNTLLPAVAPPLLEGPVRPVPAEGDDACDVGRALEPYGLAAAGGHIFPFSDFFLLQRDLVEPILEHPQESLFVGVPPGGGKTVVAELFVLSFLQECALQEDDPSDATGTAQASVAASKQKMLYISSNEEVVSRRFMDWRYKFGDLLRQRVVKLDRRHGLRQQCAEVEGATIILTTGASLISLVRRRESAFANVTHIIADHLHLLRAPEGRPMEECLARLNAMPYIVQGGKRRARLLALSYSLISCAEVCRWLKIPLPRQFNYGNSFRQLRLRMEALELPSARSRYETSLVAALKLLQKPPYRSAASVVYVPYARDAEEVARRVLLRCRDFVPEIPVAGTGDIEDPRLRLLLAAGVAYIHRDTSKLDELAILGKVDDPVLHPVTQQPLPLIVVCGLEAAWRLPAAFFTTAIVCCAERWATAVTEEAQSEGGHSLEDRGPGFMDCSAMELLQMISRASTESVVFCRTARRWMWDRLLSDPLPLESCLRYPEDFRDAINAAVAQRRAKSKVDIFKLLQSHYFLHHLKSNLHFYGVPTADDIALYASEFAFHIVESLQQQGCVEVHGEVADEEGGVEVEDDPHAPVVPTMRGSTLARHGIAVATMERICQTCARDAKGGTLNSVSAVWRVIATHAVELSPSHLGDVARVTEVAEYRALHTIARALPDKLKVRYVNLDLNAPATKVYLLVLAHCARFFQPMAMRSDGGHPLALAEVDPSDVKLLQQIPLPLAIRLEDDLHELLPTVRRVVGAVAELLDGRHHWQQARYLMHFTQCVQRRVWVDENELQQLSLVQSGLPPDLASAAKLIAAVPQINLGLLHDPLGEGTVLKALQRALQSDGTAPKDATALVEALCSQARSIPLVQSLTAQGRIEEVEGVLTFVVDVLCDIQWAGPLDTDVATPAEDAEEAVWWVSALVRRKVPADPTAEMLPRTRLLCIRRLEVESAAPPTPTDSTTRPWSLRGRLLFPLSIMDGEDLDVVELSAAVTSLSYRIDAEASVLFAAPTA